MTCYLDFECLLIFLYLIFVIYLRLASKLEEKAVEMKAKVTVKAKSVIQSIKEKREGSDSISILDSPFHHDGLSGTEFSRTREVYFTKILFGCN